MTSDSLRDTATGSASSYMYPIRAHCSQHDSPPQAFGPPARSAGSLAKREYTFEHATEEDSVWAQCGYHHQD